MANRERETRRVIKIEEFGGIRVITYSDGTATTSQINEPPKLPPRAS